MSQDPELSLRDRLNQLDDDPERGRSRLPARPGAALMVGGVAVLSAGLVYLFASSAQRPQTSIPTQAPAEFQTRGPAFGDLMPGWISSEPEPEPEAEPETTARVTVTRVPVTPAAEPPAAETTTTVITAAPEADPAIGELASLVQGLQSEIAALRDGAAATGNGEASEEAMLLLAQADALQAQLDAQAQEARFERERLERELQERGRELQQLQTDLDLARLQTPVQPMFEMAPVGEDPARAELERRRAEAQAEEEARRRSPMIAYSGASATSQSELDSARLDPNDEFVRDGARPAQVQRAEVIANPSNTVTQGTMIQASLETAIDSSLPGPIRAVITQDVHSYDGNRRLIPRGSKLIGRYSSGVEIGQGRVMVAWDRIILPDNQSVQISGYGMDEIGRSGAAGRVDSRFIQRFGSAALISVINAVPAALARGNQQTGTNTGPNVGQAIAEDMRSITGSAMAEYLNIPPRITINQGARVTVMVDRDLEIF